MTSTVYFAKWILLPDGNILTNGAIVVTGDTISSIGPRSLITRTSKDRNVNLGKRLLLPGMINIHTHLEEGAIRGHIKSDTDSFLTWTLKKEMQMKNCEDKRVISSIRLGIRECLANGITSVVDTSRKDLSLAILREEPIRSWVMYEVGRKEVEAEPDFLKILSQRIDTENLQPHIGIAPHTLYSLTPKSHKMLQHINKQHNFLWGCHMAESAEEFEAFTEQSGNLYFHITRKQEWSYGNTERGSLYYAITNNLIPDNGILYHCNYASSQELSLIATKNISIVLCNQHNTMLGHKNFPMETAINRNVNICLGTESPITFNTMNFFDELYNMKCHYPHIPAKEMLNWITKNPAKALRCSDKLGSLEKGKKADIIGVQFPVDSEENILEEMIMSEPEINFVMVDGEEIMVG